LATQQCWSKQLQLFSTPYKIPCICYVTIVVNPHNPQEEQALLAFLDNMKYDYSREDETFVLSDARQKEILERDREYEAGETETYSIDEIIAQLTSKKNNVPIAGS
jgi:hypothetical protein